jgi:hypothetical protein
LSATKKGIIMIKKILIAAFAAISFSVSAYGPYDPTDMIIYNQYNDPTDLGVMTRTVDGMTQATCSDGPCAITSGGGFFRVCDARPICYEYEHGDTSGSIFDTRTGETTDTNGETTQGEPTMSPMPPTAPNTDTSTPAP